jgi:hypothetical protein
VSSACLLCLTRDTHWVIGAAINQEDAIRVAKMKDLIMNFHEIVAPATHPYLLDLRLDPVDVHRLRRMLDEDRDDTARVVRVDRSKSDVWIVTLACASAQVRDLLDSAWG